LATPFFRDYQVIIKDHPNSLKFNLCKNYTDLAKNYSFIDYYPPDSNIDSYELLEVSDLIITFGSTLGLEALFKGIKVICLTKLYASYAVELPGILTYDPLNPDIDKLRKFADQQISKEEIVESCIKVAASIVKHDVEIPGWSYQENDSGAKITF
jgi:capsule polysaccharide modification protein KpsS